MHVIFIFITSMQAARAILVILRAADSPGFGFAGVVSWPEEGFAAWETIAEAVARPRLDRL
jgi:hypothetical protein